MGLIDRSRTVTAGTAADTMNVQGTGNGVRGTGKHEIPLRELPLLLKPAESSSFKVKTLTNAELSLINNKDQLKSRLIDFKKKAEATGKNTAFLAFDTIEKAAKFIGDHPQEIIIGTSIIVATGVVILGIMYPPSLVVSIPVSDKLLVIAGAGVTVAACQAQSPISPNTSDVQWGKLPDGSPSNPIPVPSPTIPAGKPTPSPTPTSTSAPGPTPTPATQPSSTPFPTSTPGQPTPTPTTTTIPCLEPTPSVDNEMDNENASGWEKSSWPNGGVFNNTFKQDHISFNNGIMTLTLDKNSCPSGCSGYPYASGEYRTTQKYGNGYYETSMKAAKGPGLVSAFFTYTGTWGQKDHHEIDFEVLGKDTTKVQLNYYSAGTGKNDEHVKMVNLGFDASQGFHKYAFLWTNDSIEFFIDGKSVHKATVEIPSEPGQIFGNFWPGTHQISGWLGGDYAGDGENVQYDYMKYTQLKNGSSCSSPAPQPTIQPTQTPAPQPTTTPIPTPSTPSIGNLSSFNFLAKSGFNGATGGISGNNITLDNMNSNDAGYTMFFDRTLSGNFKFDLKSGTCKIIFIKGTAPEKWQQDIQLQTPISVNKLGDNSISIPAGTNKINIMGPSAQNIELENVSIE